MKITLKKTFFLLGIIVSAAWLIIIAQPFFRTYLIKRYVDLNLKIWAVEDEVLKNRSYEVREIPSEITFFGQGEKLFLIDDYGHTWVFKIYIVKVNPYLEAQFSRFVRFLGFETPFLTIKTFLINNRPYTGSLQEYCENSVLARASTRGHSFKSEWKEIIVDLVPVSFLFGALGPDYLMTKNKLVIVDLGDFPPNFGYLALNSSDDGQINDFFIDGFLRDLNDQSQIKIIKEHIVNNISYGGSERNEAQRYRLWKEFWRQKTVERVPLYIKDGYDSYTSLEKGMQLVNFISEIPDDLFLKLIGIVEIKDNQVHAMCSSFLIERKHCVREFFAATAIAVAKEKWNRTIDVKKSLSSGTILKMTVKKYVQLNVLLLKRCFNKPNASLQKPLKAVMCPDAWWVLFNHHFNWLDYNSAKNILERIVFNTKYANEKIVAEYYLKLLDKMENGNNNMRYVIDNKFRYKVAE